MPVSCVLDTNVLVVAMAADTSSSIKSDATCVDDPVLRLEVLKWLIKFDKSTQAIVIDFKGLIWDEYRGKNRRDTKLTEQDYCMQLILSKKDR